MAHETLDLDLRDGSTTYFFLLFGLKVPRDLHSHSVSGSPDEKNAALNYLDN